MPDIDMTITLHRSRSGKWRATFDEGATQTAVLGETAEAALAGILRSISSRKTAHG